MKTILKYLKPYKWNILLIFFLVRVAMGICENLGISKFNIFASFIRKINK